MKLAFKVKNLGKLKSGTVKLRPLTVLTGENGTGKSFFTKTLYSIFSVINKNVLHAEISKLIENIERFLSVLIHEIYRQSQTDRSQVKQIQTMLIDLKARLNTIKDEDINIYLSELDSIVANFQTFESYLQDVEEKPIKLKSIGWLLTRLRQNIQQLERHISNGEREYASLLIREFSNEIKENFQIAHLSELITFDEKQCEISTEGLKIHFNNKINFELQHAFIDEVFHLSRVVFFESPAYWSVRDALNNSKEVAQPNDLTGVPKYFYDLDKTLNTKSKNPPLEKVLQLADDLKAEIGGEFIFEGGRLSFRDNEGRNIDKNLISFGMTNLGMVQALLKNNVISKGSFVFFDEPETNLHPTWQVLLTQVLIKLAESGVNVVMATHSLDMIKALEVHTKGKDGDFMAVNHFTKAGGLFEFDSDDITENLIASRNELMSAYEDLFLSELYDPEND